MFIRSLTRAKVLLRTFGHLNVYQIKFEAGIFIKINKKNNLKKNDIDVIN